MCRWIFFWRRRQRSQSSALAAAPQQEMAKISGPGPMRESNSESKDGTVVLPAPQLRSVPAIPFPDANSVLVLPARGEMESEVASRATTQAHDAALPRIGETASFAVDEWRRIAYFTRGSYAPARLCMPRLLAPISSLRSRRRPVSSAASGSINGKSSPSGLQFPAAASG